jgi:hypothetical protein
MIISHVGRYVFIALPKTGSSGMSKALIEHFSGIDLQPHHRTIVPGECLDYCVFTVVRNPYSRALSLWKFCQRRPNHRLHELASKLSFRDFMLWMADRTIHPVVMLRPMELEYFYPEARPLLFKGRDPNQTEFLSMNRDAHFIKLEYLDLQFHRLPFMKSGPFGHLHNFSFEVTNNDPDGTNGVPTQMLLDDPVLEQAIYDWAGPDFINFGYTRVRGDKMFKG